MNDWMKIAPATITSPSVISGRGPTRSVSRPDSGAMTMMKSVEGRKRMPVCSGE